MRDASDGIKRLTLELGGEHRTSCSPTRTSPTPSRAPRGRSTTRPGRAARRAPGSWSSTRPYDDFVSQFSEAAKQIKLGDPLEAETQVRSLISTDHRDRVHGYVETGKGEGAEVVAGGEPVDGKGAFYPPTVLAGVSQEMTVAQEEIFGPHWSRSRPSTTRRTPCGRRTRCATG